MNNTIRSFFPVLSSSNYLNTAYVGPMSTELFDFRNKLEKEYLKDADRLKIDSSKRINEYRETISEFVGSSQENTFFNSNFSTAFRIILDFIPKNSRVLSLKNDYNSLVDGINERDFLVDYISITSDFEIIIKKQLEKKKYDVLALSVVQFLSGLKVDFSILKEIRNKHPDLIIIGDATQFMGSDFFNFNDSPFDVIVGSGYKWMMAGFGNAYLSVSSNFLNLTSSNSQKIYDKFYAGHINLLGAASLDFAIKFLQKNNYNQLISYKNKLGSYLKDELKKLNLLDPIIERRKNHSSIFVIRGDQKLYNKLRSYGIKCSLKISGIRISVHFYNIESEVDNLIEVLKKLN